MNELDYLSRTKDSNGDVSEHADMVRTSAVAAVEYLEAGFDARNPRMRAVTSRGTTLTTISFRSEEKEQDTVWTLSLWLLYLLYQLYYINYINIIYYINYINII